MAEQRRERKQFSFELKYRILQELGRGRKKSDVAKQFGISLSTLSTFIKDAPRVESGITSATFNPVRKRLRTAKHEDIDDAVYIWFQDVRSKNIPISGPLLREKAVEYSRALGHDDFQASVGWLNRFRDRYGIRAKVLCGESGDAPTAQANEWKEAGIKDIISEYDVDDVYNADETALFYQLLPEGSLTVSGDACEGGKKSKQRLTALLCCHASGSDQRKLLMIGKSVRPHCLKNVKSSPYQYRGDKKAWMTSKLFSEWLIGFDREMKRAGRHVLLLLDNCSAHNVI